MSIGVSRGKGKTQRVLRRKKMTIIEEEEFFLTEDIVEEPSEVIFQDFVVQNIPIPSHATVSFESQNEPDLEDIEERKELSKIVGLQEVPMKTVDAFDEIMGIFDNVASKDELDTVKMVKAIRRRC
jgi:hypothetical protein